MERNWKRICVTLGLALLTAAAFFLRQTQPRDRGGFLVVLSVAAVAAFGLCARLLQPRTEYPAGRSVPAMLASLAAAAFLFGGALLRYQQGEKLALTALLAVSALCWAVTALLLGKKPVCVWFMIIPTVFFAAELVTKFRFWGSDPQILDYCYELLALIATMCAVFHSGSFCFGKGQRRLTAFYCLCGVFFHGHSSG